MKIRKATEVEQSLKLDSSIVPLNTIGERLFTQLLTSCLCYLRISPVMTRTVSVSCIVCILKKIYVSLCLHNMHSFNYEIWQWINTGALFFHRLVLSIQATFLLTLLVPAKSLAACPFRLERHWWWKKLSPILHSTLQKLAARGGMGISLPYRKSAGYLLMILISKTM